MADLTPLGAIFSYAGTSILSIAGVASIGFPSIASTPVEAYAQTLGARLPVDLLNGVTAPTKDVLSCEVLVRAADTITDPLAAWAAVVAGVRALQSLPESGTLTVSSYPSGGYVSCQARRKRFPIMLKPSNARFYVVALTFTLLSEFV